jgi:AcrR family transcriptional regulator
MGRHKTISDDDVLRVARTVFTHHGHTATTRQVAEAAGVSEAVLYQRFGNKDHLFFAAMHPAGPDVDRLLGPVDPPDDARAYLQSVLTRLADFFAEAIPLALRLMTHPSFDPAEFFQSMPRNHSVLRDGLAERIGNLVRRKRLAPVAAPAAAQLVVSLAHDWALAAVLAHGAPRSGTRSLREMVDVLWRGLGPAD